MCVVFVMRFMNIFLLLFMKFCVYLCYKKYTYIIVYVHF